MEENEKWVPTHPAEKAAQHSDSEQTGNSDDQILRSLRKQVFSIPLLPQDRIQTTFVELDKKLEHCVDLILNNSSHFRLVIMQTIAKVAAGNTYGKNIYEKSEELAGGGAEPTYKPHEVDFLRRSYKFLYDSSLDQNVTESFKRCKFIRGMFEEVIFSAFEELSDYRDLHWQCFEAKLEGNPDRYSSLVYKINAIDSKFGLSYKFFGISELISVTHKYFLEKRAFIIAPYLRAVYKIARQTAKTNSQMLDNFQNGSIGLVRAVSCYSSHRPTSFSSIAKWWIKQMVLLAIKEDANFVKLPVSTWQAHTQLEKVRAKLGGEEDFKQIAKETKMSQKRVKTIYDTIKIAQVYSLNKTYDGEDKLTLEDIIVDKQEEEVSLSTKLREFCEKTKFTEQEIVTLALRFGCADLIPFPKIDLEEVKVEAIRQNISAFGYNFKY